MLSLSDVLNAAKVTIEKIEETSKAALRYIDVWNIAGGNKNAVGRFFRFINQWIAKNPGTSRQDATQEYWAANYWANQGKILGQVDEGVVLPRSVYRTVILPADKFTTGQNYRYQVTATVTWLKTGYTGTYNTYVFSKIPLTQEGINAQAAAQIREYFKDTSKPGEDQDEDQYWWFSTHINEFTTLLPKG